MLLVTNMVITKMSILSLSLRNLKSTWFLIQSICSYGCGSRIKLPYTRKIIDAIHSGSLLNVEYKKTEIFGLEIPTEVEGVPSEILDPKNTVSCS
jgi:ATP-dependent phosphoenolpyruvate carboxykinase